MDKSVKNVNLINAISMVLANTVTFLISPVFSRLLGTGNYGIASAYATWGSMVYAVFGLQADATLKDADNSFLPEERAEYHSSVLLMSVMTYLVLSTAAVLFIGPVSAGVGLSRELVILILIQGIGQICVQFAGSKLIIGSGEVKNLVLTISTSLVNVFLSLLLITIFPKNINYLGRVIGQAATFFVAGTACFVFVMHHGKMRISGRYWKFCLSLSLPVIIHRLSDIILNSCDKIMIKRFISSSQAGIYNLALGFATIISIIWVLFNNSWVPFYSKAEYCSDKEGIVRHSKNYMELFSAITVVFLLISPEFFHIYAGEEYWNGSRLVSLLVMGFYYMFMSSFIVNRELYYKKNSAVITGTVLAALFNVTMNYFMIKKFGVFGATSATALAHFIRLLFHCIAATLLFEKDECPYSIKFFAPWMFPVTLIAAGLFFVEGRVWFIRWAAAIVLVIIQIYKIHKRKSFF